MRLQNEVMLGFRRENLENLIGRRVRVELGDLLEGCGQYLFLVILAQSLFLDPALQNRLRRHALIEGVIRVFPGRLRPCWLTRSGLGLDRRLFSRFPCSPSLGDGLKSRFRIDFPVLCVESCAFQRLFDHVEVEVRLFLFRLHQSQLDSCFGDGGRGISDDVDVLR